MAEKTKKISNINKINITQKCGKNVTDINVALDCADLNFIAGEVGQMGYNGIENPDKKMIFRADTDQYLGTVGNSYHPVQNSLAMAFMDQIVQKNGYHYTEAISKDNGAVSTLIAQSTRPDEIAQGDEVCRQIKIYNGFNGIVGLAVEFSMIRLVCTNGMTRNERESVIRFRHTVKVHERMAVALKVFDQSVKFHDDFVEKSRILAQTAMDKAMVEQFLNGLYKDIKQNKKKRDTIIDLAHNGMGNNGESVWHYLNGVTEYVDHHHGTEEKNRMDFANFGQGLKLKSKAWDLAMSLV